MESNTVLKSMLDQLSVTMDLTSWTVHENLNRTVCVLRFGKVSTILDSSSGNNSKNTARRYRLQSDNQVKRDETRMSNFIDKKCLNDQTCDNVSIDIPSSDEIHLSGPDQSSNHVNNQPAPLNVEAYPFRMTTESLSTSPSCEESPSKATVITPELASIYTNATLEERPAYCGADTTDTVRDTSDTVDNKETDLPSTTTTDNSMLTQSDDLDRKNVTKQKVSDVRSLSDDILCDVCCAIPPFKTDLLYCKECNFHMCGACALTNPINHSIDCDYDMQYKDTGQLYHLPDTDSKPFEHCASPPNKDNAKMTKTEDSFESLDPYSQSESDEQCVVPSFNQDTTTMTENTFKSPNNYSPFSYLYEQRVPNLSQVYSYDSYDSYSQYADREYYEPNQPNEGDEVNGYKLVNGKWLKMAGYRPRYY